MNTWRVFDPTDTDRPPVTIPVKRDAYGEWFKHESMKHSREDERFQNAIQAQSISVLQDLQILLTSRRQ
jgi:hypothetical protein